MPLQLPPPHPCSFCDYLAGEREYTVLDRDAVTALLITREQRGVGHVLVIPVSHSPTLCELSPAERTGIMDGVVRASRAILGAFDPAGVAVWQNTGVPAHQKIPHVHFHVAGTLPEGGTALGGVDRLEVPETDAIADRLRPHLD
jgi:histidine triad (HIT) family protein